MKPIQKLAQRLESEHEIKIDVSTFARTRSGYWQRSQGAWSWFAYLKLDDATKIEIGSQYPVTTLLLYRELQVTSNACNQLEIAPLNMFENS